MNASAALACAEPRATARVARSARSVRPLARALVAAALALLGGCSSWPEPWVKPYERERLADPLMQASRHPLIDRHREHIHSVREGARGATGVQGGGCGCN